MFRQGIKNIIYLILVSLLLISGSGTSRIESAEARSGIIRGGFSIDGSGSSREMPASIQPNSGRNAQNTGQQNPPSGSSENTENQGVTQGRIPAESSNQTNSRQNAGAPQTSTPRTAAAQTETAQKKKNRPEDDVDYKKIYFLIISALILFLYLIFGLKRRGRRRSSNSKAHRYYR